MPTRNRDRSVPQRPFRWDIARREQLGSLLSGEHPQSYPEFNADLRTLSAQVLARGGGADLVFVGRSVESVFDYLSGIFSNVARPPALSLLQFSAPNETPAALAQKFPKEFRALRDYFDAERLAPPALMEGRRKVRFVDVVSGGWTFTALYQLQKYWTEKENLDWAGVRRRFGFLGITARTRNSPNTWRWQQHKDWTADLPGGAIANISVPWRFWRYVANSEEKATPSFWLPAWGDPDAAKPSHYEMNLRGLRRAVRLYDRGRSAIERERFARALAAQPEMATPAVRGYAQRLKLAKSE